MTRLLIRGPLLGLFVALLANSGHAMALDREHPFLLCRRDQFPELRQLSKLEPWRTMRSDAMQRVAGTYEQGSPRSLGDYIGALGLAYILQPEKAGQHADEVAGVIIEGLESIEFNPEKKHRGTVPPLAAAFHCILALDVVWDDLSPEQRTHCTKVIERKVQGVSRSGPWILARYGTFHTLDMFLGRREGPDDLYYTRLMKQMTRDGVSTTSPAYAQARVGAGNDRPQKSAYADVLEFTGYDRRYYDNPRMEKFYRWFFNSCISPDLQFPAFGDQKPNWKPANQLLYWRVGRFDRQASAHAAWLLREFEPQGHLLPYLLMKEPLPAPDPPRGGLYEDGGAFFHQAASDPEGFSAFLYNTRFSDMWHANRETNGIGLAAFGTKMLVNGGWLGPPTEPAPLQNTMTVNEIDHTSKSGAGLVGGLMSDGLAAVSGHSAGALPGAHFVRSLLFIEPQPDHPGYIAVVDRVSNEEDDQVQVYWHPATEDKPEVVESKRIYQAEINHHANVSGSRLNITLITPPEKVKFDQVPSGFLDRSPDVGSHYRMRADYAGKNPIILTVLQPLGTMTDELQFTGPKDAPGGPAFQVGKVGEGDLLLTDLKATDNEFHTDAEILWLRRGQQGHPRMGILMGASRFTSRGLKLSANQRINLLFHEDGLWIETFGGDITINGRSFSLEPGRHHLDSAGLF
jgi:hypothetical protein